MAPGFKFRPVLNFPSHLLFTTILNYIWERLSFWPLVASLQGMKACVPCGRSAYKGVCVSGFGLNRRVLSAELHRRLLLCHVWQQQARTPAKSQHIVRLNSRTFVLLLLSPPDAQPSSVTAARRRVLIKPTSRHRESTQPIPEALKKGSESQPRHTAEPRLPQHHGNQIANTPLKV